MKNKPSYKLVLTTLAIASLVTLTACGGKDKNTTANETANKATKVVANTAKKAEIAVSKVGLNGKFDESGLAKRVAKALGEEPNMSTVYVAQTGDVIILKGSVAEQKMLDKAVSVAKGVKGVSFVNSSELTVK